MQQGQRKQHSFSGTCLSSRRLSNVLYPRKRGALEHRQGGFQLACREVFELQPAQSSARASAASKASQEAPAGKGPSINVSSVKNKENLKVWVLFHGLGWCATSSCATEGHQCAERRQRFRTVKYEGERRDAGKLVMLQI